MNLEMQIKIIHRNTQTSTILLELDYTRDWRGIITQLVEKRNDAASVVQWDFTYDTQKRLLSAERDVTAGSGSDISYNYTYDGAGNRLTKAIDGNTTTYTHNQLDQLTGDGTYTYQYDSYGNLKTKKQDSTVKEEYLWNDSNDLTKAILHDPTEKTIHFTYDDQNTRIGRRVVETGSEDATKYLTAYKNPTGYSQALAEVDTDGNSENKYIYGSQLLTQNDGSDLEHFHSDHLGSTRLLTQSDGSTISGSDLGYTPYGDPLTGTSSLTSYHYTGQYRDESLALQYHRTRWLNNSLGNWLSIDPVFDFPVNFGSVYSYAGANSINKIDPSGTYTLAEVAGTLILVASLVSTGFSAYNFYKEPTWANGAWLIVDILSFIPGVWLLKWASKGISIASKAMKARSAASFLLRTTNMGIKMKGELFEAWVLLRLIKGKIGSLGKLVGVSTTWAQGAANVGNDLIAIGRNGIPKVFEISTNALKNATKNATKNDIMEYSGIAKRLLKLLDKNINAVNELRRLGIDPRFLNRSRLDDIVKGIG